MILICPTHFKEPQDVYDPSSADRSLRTFEDILLGRAGCEQPQSPNDSDIDLDEIAAYLEPDGATNGPGGDGVTSCDEPNGIESHVNENMSMQLNIDRPHQSEPVPTWGMTPLSQSLHLHANSNIYFPSSSAAATSSSVMALSPSSGLAAATLVEPDIMGVSPAAAITSSTFTPGYAGIASDPTNEHQDHVNDLLREIKQVSYRCQLLEHECVTLRAEWKDLIEQYALLRGCAGL